MPLQSVRLTKVKLCGSVLLSSSCHCGPQGAQLRVPVAGIWHLVGHQCPGGKLLLPVLDQLQRTNTQQRVSNVVQSQLKHVVDHLPYATWNLNPPTQTCDCRMHKHTIPHVLQHQIYKPPHPLSVSSLT